MYDSLLVGTGLGFAERLPITWEAAIVAFLEVLLLTFLGSNLILGSMAMSAFSKANEVAIQAATESYEAAVGNANNVADLVPTPTCYETESGGGAEPTWVDASDLPEASPVQCSACDCVCVCL